MRRILLAGCLAVLAAAGSGACGQGRQTTADTDETSTTAPRPSARFTMTLSETRLRPGATFSVTYHAIDPTDAAGIDRLVISEGIVAAGIGFEAQWMLSPGATLGEGRATHQPLPVPAAHAVGVGPHYYRLPDRLYLGAYRFCATLRPYNDQVWEEEEKVCASATVYRRAADGTDVTTSPTASDFTDLYTMTLSENRLRPGAAFSVTYLVNDPDDPANDDDISNSDRLTLGRDGEWLWWLYARDAERGERTVPVEPEWTGVGHGVSVSQPSYFRLPDRLDPGTYRLCDGLRPTRVPALPDLSAPRPVQVCAEVTVE